MAIDWTKPIRQKNGRALRFLHELQNASAKYTMVCVVTQEDGNEYVFTYTKDGSYNRDNKRGSTYDLENIPDTEPAQPEIDWAGEVQVRFKQDPPLAWTDVIIGYHDNDVALGWKAEMGPRHVLVLNFDTNEFRNKPAEPKRVQCWVNVYNKNTGIVWFTKELAEKHAGSRIACVAIDVPEGHGLEERK